MIELIMAFGAISAMFALFGDLLIKLFDIFTMLFPIIPLIFDPVRLVNEVITGIVLGITTLFQAFLDLFNPSTYFSSNKSKKKTNLDTIKCDKYDMTALNIIILVICPPFAIFQRYGAEKFWQIILCAFLSVYCYYIPGLVYALMLVLGRSNKCKR